MLAIVTITGNEALAAQLLNNGTIERYHGYDLPFRWDWKSNAGAKVCTDSGISHGGDNSLEFDLDTANYPEWRSATFRVIPNETYDTTCWYKVTERYGRGSHEVYIRFWDDADRSNLRSQTQVASGIGSSTCGWTDASQSANCPANASYADILLWSNGARSYWWKDGHSYFDDFTVEKSWSRSAVASNRSPSDGSYSAGIQTTLSWTAQQGADSYDLYLGDDYNSVEDANTSSSEYEGNLTNYSYKVMLRPYRDYFWRLDKVDDPNTTKGRVYSMFPDFDLLEDIAGADSKGFDVKDSQSNGLHGAQIIENPTNSAYIAIYHSYFVGDGEFDVRVANSPNMSSSTWTYQNTLSTNSSMPCIYWHSKLGGYFVAHEQWQNSGTASPCQLRFRYYPSTDDLFDANATKDYTAALTLGDASNLEGTPAILYVSDTGNTIDIGFHYYDTSENADRVGWGTLTNFMSGERNWDTSAATDYNTKMENLGVAGNIGDRDYGKIFDTEYMLQEGQYESGQWDSWRAFFKDYDSNSFFRMYPVTPNGSITYGNMTGRYMVGPNGNPCMVGAYFIFGEGAGPGEPAECIFYNYIDVNAMPDPNITASYTAYSGAYSVNNIMDENSVTEYASLNGGTSTYIDFDFGSAERICGFKHVERDDSATVAESELQFSNTADFSTIIKTVTVTHHLGEPASTTFQLFQPVKARYVRWNVTKIRTSTTVGGAEIDFYAPQ